MKNEIIWVFHSSKARFTGGIFSSKKLAEEWILKHKLTGMLTAYPLNSGVFDWAIESNLFQPKGENHNNPEFIGGFTSASQEHYHYEDGQQA